MFDTKYRTIWTTALGKSRTLEEMTENHLLNCYQHVKNNMGYYYGFESARTGSNSEGWKEVMTILRELKQELLLRNVKEDIIENWVEQRELIGRTDTDYKELD